MCLYPLLPWLALLGCGPGHDIASIFGRENRNDRPSRRIVNRSFRVAREFCDVLDRTTIPVATKSVESESNLMNRIGLLSVPSSLEDIVFCELPGYGVECLRRHPKLASKLLRLEVSYLKKPLERRETSTFLVRTAEAVSLRHDSLLDAFDIGGLLKVGLSNRCVPRTDPNLGFLARRN